MYETKVVLVAVSNIMRKSKSLKEAHTALEEMANAEGVVLKPFAEPEPEPDGEDEPCSPCS
jgi:hypothetical protein